MARVWILSKFAVGVVVLCISGPSLLGIKIGLAFVIGLATIAAILFRNKWRRTAGAVMFAAILNAYAIGSALYLPRWQDWARNLPATIEKGTPEQKVLRSLWWRSSMMNVRKQGSQSFIDIHPVGPAGWIRMNYWRVILDVDESRRVVAANSVEVKW